MEIKIRRLVGWDEALDAARFTVSKAPLHKTPSDEWIRKVLMAEHSVIREVRYVLEMTEVPCWISQHISRHDAFSDHYVRETKETHFVGTSRPDRTGGLSRHELPQDAPVCHRISLSAEDFLHISYRRLCGCASPETRKLWQDVIKALEILDPVLASVCVPACVYRSRCPEMNCCGFSNTEKFRKQLAEYWKPIEIGRQPKQ